MSVKGFIGRSGAYFSARYFYVYQGLIYKKGNSGEIVDYYERAILESKRAKSFLDKIASFFKRDSKKRVIKLSF